jgi:hypothetical protein
VLLPRVEKEDLIFDFKLSTVASTLIIQKMPTVMPNNDKKVRSLLERNSCNAILKLLMTISRNLNISQK